eukprot:1138693-Pelagomonas_calceolata.AAC.3
MEAVPAGHEAKAMPAGREAKALPAGREAKALPAGHEAKAGQWKSSRVQELHECLFEAILI